MSPTFSFRLTCEAAVPMWPTRHCNGSVWASPDVVSFPNPLKFLTEERRMLVVTNWNMRHVDPPREIRNQAHLKPIVESQLSLVEQAMIERIPNLVLACLSQASTTDFRYLPSRFSSPSGSSSAGKLLLNYPTEHSRTPCRSARSLHPAEHSYVALFDGTLRSSRPTCPPNSMPIGETAARWTL